jgi:hypothetical protein
LARLEMNSTGCTTLILLFVNQIYISDSISFQKVGYGMSSSFVVVSVEEVWLLSKKLDFLPIINTEYSQIDLVLNIL